MHSTKDSNRPLPNVEFLRHSTFWLVAALFVISAWVLSHRIYAVHELGDEGYFVNAAMRILSGEIIYRDFQHNYPPGRMYVLALLIKLFGQDLIVVRAFWVACHSASVAVGFCVARRMMSLPLALCVAVVILANSVAQNKAVELLVAALILLILLRAWEGKVGDVAAGVWLGCLTYFRHDVAVMGCMVFGLQTLLQAYLDARDARYWIRLRARWSQAWRFVAAYGIVGSVFALFLLYHGAFIVAFQDLALSGFNANVELSRPFPALVHEWSLSGLWEAVLSDRVVYYTPPLVYAICAACGLWGVFRSDRKVHGGQLFSAAILGSLIFLQVLPRTDPGHLNKAYLVAHVLSFALVSILLTAALSKARQKRWIATGALLLMTVPALGIPIKQFDHHARRRASPVEILKVKFLKRGPPYKSVEFPHGRLSFRLKSGRAQMQAINDEIAKYEEFREQETLLGYPAGAVFNFLYDYPNPVAYDVLRPGELGNNDPALLKDLMKKIRKARPRALMHVKEGTNSKLSNLVGNWAHNTGYKYFEGPNVDAWIRSD